MSAQPPRCGVDSEGNVVFGEGGILDPGWKAAIAMLQLEAKLAAGAVAQLTDEGELDTTTGCEDLFRLEACQLAVRLLKTQGQRIGLDVS